mgnify:CR=1 FL=1
MVRAALIYFVLAMAAAPGAQGRYAAPGGGPNVFVRVMVLGAGGVWSLSIPVATLNSYGVSGTVYYGYRAWGPNWTYVSSWSKGSATGFVSDVDSSGNRFNPNNLKRNDYMKVLPFRRV